MKEKRVKEMSRDELLALTPEQIEHHIDLECAHEGVALLPPFPVEPIIETPQPDLPGFGVGGFIFLDKADAEKVRDFVAMLPRVRPAYIKGQYSYSGPQTLEPMEDDDEIAVGRVMYWTRAHYDKTGSAYDLAKKTKAQYAAALKEYNEASSSRAVIRDEIMSKINTAHSEVYEEDGIRREFERYIEIAGGDKEIAFAFFMNVSKKRYDAEFVSSVVGFWPIQPLQNAIAAATADVAPATAELASLTHHVGCVCESCSAGYERDRRDPRDGA